MATETYFLSQTMYRLSRQASRGGGGGGGLLPYRIKKVLGMKLFWMSCLLSLSLAGLSNKIRCALHDFKQLM